MLREDGWGWYLVHTWHWGEPNHGPTEILTNGEGDGGCPWSDSFRLWAKHFTPVRHRPLTTKNSCLVVLSSLWLHAQLLFIWSQHWTLASAAFIINCWTVSFLPFPCCCVFWMDYWAFPLLGLPWSHNSVALLSFLLKCGYWTRSQIWYIVCNLQNSYWMNVSLDECFTR